VATHRESSRTAAAYSLLREGVNRWLLKTEQPFGIRVLIWLSLLIGVWTILGSVVFFTYPLFLSKYGFPETHAQRAASIVFGLVGAYWGRWWYRQKYFSKAGL
jgi:hypothetical protein